MSLLTAEEIALILAAELANDDGDGRIPGWLDAAKHSLMQKKSPEWVARRCHFNRLATFIKDFSKATGLSPNDWIRSERARQRKDELSKLSGALNRRLGGGAGVLGKGRRSAVDC